MIPEPFITGIVLFYAWLFGLSAYHKLTALAYYRSLVQEMFEGLPGLSGSHETLHLLIVIAIAATEAGLALILIIPGDHSMALAGSAVMLLLYAAIMFNQIRQGRSGMDCGCAGPASEIAVNTDLVYRNLLYALPAGVGLLSAEPQAFSATMATLSLGIAAFLIAVYSCHEQLIANSQRAIALGLVPRRASGGGR